MLTLIIILLITLLLLAVTVYAATLLHRRKHPDEEPEVVEMDSECCGAHAVCEKERLLNSSNKATYYDDEELDSLAGIHPDNYTRQQREMIADVFYTLREKDVAGWLRSLQIRQIELPEDLRDEALLIVRERRGL